MQLTPITSAKQATADRRIAEAADMARYAAALSAARTDPKATSTECAVLELALANAVNAYFDDAGEAVVEYAKEDVDYSTKMCALSGCSPDWCSCGDTAAEDADHYFAEWADNLARHYSGMARAA